MARGALHNFALVHQSRQEQMATRDASVARIKELLTESPKTAAELAQVLAEELQVVRATVFGYLRTCTRGSAASARPAIRAVARRCAVVPARQMGMFRHWMDEALFGPARGVAA